MPISPADTGRDSSGRFTKSPFKIAIQGLQAAQQANQKMIAELQGGGALGEAVRGAALGAQRYAITITHVGRYWRGKRWLGGGALRASHRVEANGNRGFVYLDPGAVNPFTRQKTSEYGVHEHNRGYPHNFYERTVDERGAQIAQAALNTIRNAMP